MAPIKKRSSIRARAAASPHTAAHPSNPAADAISASDLSSLRLKKQDKRHLKHATLMHKVRDASISKPSSSQKRRRPGNKMPAADRLGGLRDALPAIDGEEEDEWEGFSDGASEGEGVTREKAEGKIKMRSLKHRPGAMKRKHVLERREQERFGRNLAQLAWQDGSGKGDGSIKEGGGQEEKWRALRTFIGGTIDRDRAFGKG